MVDISIREVSDESKEEESCKNLSKFSSDDQEEMIKSQGEANSTTY